MNTLTRKSSAISDVSSLIRDQTGMPPPGGHKQIHQLCIDGKVPGAHRVNNRWRIWDDTIPELIEILGMSVAA